MRGTCTGQLTSAATYMPDSPSTRSQAREEPIFLNMWVPAPDACQFHKEMLVGGQSNPFGLA